MIIIAVLGVIGILLVMNLQLCSDTLYSERMLSRLQNRESSYYVGRSVYNAAVKLLQMDEAQGGKVDSLKDLWAFNPHEYELDEGKITVIIEDENRYFDLNSIADKEGKPEEKHFKQLERLLDQREINVTFANAVLDWMDKDSTATSPGGSEVLKDSDFPCKNARFDSIEELYFLNNFNDAWFKGSVEKEGEYRPGLKDLLTAHSNGKVNINTAGVDILQSLDKDLTRQMCQEILSKRADEAFEKVDDLLDVPGFNSDLVYRIKYLADVVSSHFRISIEVNRAGDRTLLTAIVVRESASSKCVFWKVE